MILPVTVSSKAACLYVTGITGAVSVPIGDNSY
jgi:hypothetical protein